MPEAANVHPWRFFRAGGFDQVKIETGADIIHLDQLDQKLWVALACPISSLDFDKQTAALIDTDKDGRIRAAELIAAARWAGALLKNPDLLAEGRDSLLLDSINDANPEGRQIAGSARHILANLGQAGGPAITLAQAIEGNAVFARAALNGDGVVTVDSAPEPAVQALVNEIIDCVGGATDRSGKPGVDQARADKFFSECAAFDSWVRRGEASPAVILPAGGGTADAVNAVKAIKSKVDDYFGRCRLAAFDGRIVPLLNRKEEDYAVIAAHDLSLDAAQIAGFPLAHVAPDKPLPLDGAVNPAHASALAGLRAYAVRPLLGVRSDLSEGDWLTLQGKLEPYEKWQSSKVGAAVEKLGAPRVLELLASPLRGKLNALIAADAALQNEAAAVGDLEKLLRYVRDLRHLCQNFVNFKDLYDDAATAIFQAGVLYLDRRACSLCLRVEDPARHAVMAGLSGAFLVYCDCVRRGSGESFAVVAVISQGDDDNLMVGRNGVFYDRKGRDYDATITKIISSPISLRQAFWSPYKKLSRSIEEYVAKRSADAQATVDAQLAATATSAATPGAVPPAPATPATPVAPAKLKFDPSVIALVSVALGSLAVAFASVLTFLGKFPKSELPLVFAGIGLVVSAPSLIMAFIKLRKRNLGPILDANGWAINAKASINAPFGARLTSVARVPAAASIDTHDRFEQRAALWPKLVAVAFFIWWFYAILDDAGIVSRLMQNWDTPEGPPVAHRESGRPTNSAPTDVAQPAPLQTNLPGK